MGSAYDKWNISVVIGAIRYHIRYGNRKVLQIPHCTKKPSKQTNKEIKNQKKAKLIKAV
jgi:hypothetical protein